MKNIYKLGGIILCLVLLTSGCGYEAKLSDGKEMVAELDGEKITADSLYEQMKEKHARDVLIDMIDGVILNKKYKIDDEINKAIDSQVEYFKMQTGEQFQAAIKHYFGANSEEELRKMLLLDQLRNKAVKDYVKTLITDNDINNHYNNETAGDIKASHILIKPDVTDTMTDSERSAKETEAFNLAKEIIVKLNNGEKFADLAKQYSNDKSNSDNGGDLGYFNKGKMDEAFEKAAYALTKDKYSTTPVKTIFGYHIILKTDEKVKPELKLVRNDIIDILVNNKLEENTTLQVTAMMEIRKSNKLKIYDTKLKKQYDDYMVELLKDVSN